ncbi:MAG TPA: nuclear transport factor 2 family protein [Jatrophihabitans sp.]|jgi:actinorhodin biosynthesis protein ActVIA|nr:nuclear transport factor 2 family protein [Jatrophihabitans sp.]
MARVTVGHELQSEIQDFYARQQHAIDGGRYAEFAETLTEDCQFTPVKNQPTAYGRQAIAQQLTDFAASLVGAQDRRRHWMSMNVIDEVEPDVYEVVSYSLVTSTRIGEPPILHWAGDIADRLVRVDGALKVQRREVRSDSIA